MAIIDVSHWEEDFKKQISGTRAKYWLIEPDSLQQYMFKIPIKNTGEAWAEKVSSELGKLLKMSIPLAHFPLPLRTYIRYNINMKNIRSE